jgi:hypothetical protein
MLWRSPVDFARISLTAMKHLTVLLPIFAMAALNWTTSKKYAASSSMGAHLELIDMSGISVLIGLILAATLIRLVYLEIRKALDRGVVTYPRFRIPGSVRFFRYHYLYAMLALLAAGFKRGMPQSDHIGNQFHSEVTFGIQCSTAPFWLAALCITLWNCLCALREAELSHSSVRGAVTVS